MTLLLLLAQSLALAGPCASSTTSLDLSAKVRAADTAFATMDIEGFTTARDGAEQALTCLGELVNPVDAAAYHKMRALDAFLAEDEPTAVGAFAATRRLQPGATLSESLAPLGNPLRAAWDAAGLLPDTAGESLPAPPDTVFYLDGSRAVARPAARASVLQATTSAGLVTHSAWLRPSDPLPSWAIAATLADDSKGSRPERRAREHGDRSPPTRPLLIAAGASAVVAGGLYGYAWVPRGKFLDEATPLPDLDGYRSATNAATIGAIVAGGVAIGTGAGAVLTVAW